MQPAVPRKPMLWRGSMAQCNGGACVQGDEDGSWAVQLGVKGQDVPSSRRGRWCLEGCSRLALPYADLGASFLIQTSEFF